MKIGVILFSHRGHTKKVGEKVAARLQIDGHAVHLNLLETITPLNLREEEAAIKSVPEINEYDALVLGTPVHGGRMSAPMRYFLNQTPSMRGISVVLFVTHFFRIGWGATQTLQELQKVCENKGAQYLGAANIKWLSFYRKLNIKRSVEKISAIFMD